MTKYLVDYYETYNKSYEIEACNKEETERKYDEAIQAVIDFEKEHGIKA